MYQTNYQNPSSSLNCNPMQPNLEPMKQFFNSPLYLIMGIVLLANSVLTFLSSLMSPSYYDINSILNQFNMSSYSLDISLAGSLMSLDVFSILTGISFILFYAFSKQEGDKIKAPAMIIKVVAIIQLVFVCIAFALLFIVVMLLIFAAGSITSYYGSSDSSAVLVLVLVLVPILGFLLFYCIANFTFLSGIHKTITTPQLKKNFAVFLAVTQIIALTFTIPSYLLTASYVTYDFFGFIQIFASLSYSVLYIIFLFRFSSFINEQTQRRTLQGYAQPVYNQVPVTSNSYNQQQHYNNHYSAPQTPVQPFQPTQMAPVSRPVQALCKNCGNAVGNEDSFCMYCGTPVER